MKLPGENVLMLAAVAAAVAVAWYAKSKAVEVIAQDIVPALTPWDQRNLANRAANGLYTGATGSTGTIGTDLWEATHGGPLDITSGNNVISRGVNGAWRYVGVLDEHETIGNKLYDGVDWIKSVWSN